MLTFGRSMLEHWALDPEYTYLNHGTVGAPPRRVLQRQQTLRDEMERQPSRFLLRELTGEQPMPWRTAPRLREASAQVAAFVGSRPEDLVFVPNVTTGLNAVLASVPLAAGDEVVITDLAYGAIALAAAVVCARGGAALRTAHIEYPVRDAGDVVEAIVQAITPRTRLVVVDHVTALTALVLPVAAIAAACRAREVAVLVDGAHVPGAPARSISPRSALIGMPPTCTSGLMPRAVAESCGRAPRGRSSSVLRWCRGDATTGTAASSSTQPPSIRRVTSRHPRGLLFCANGTSTPARSTCTDSLGKLLAR